MNQNQWSSSTRIGVQHWPDYARTPNIVENLSHVLVWGRVQQNRWWLRKMQGYENSVLLNPYAEWLIMNNLICDGIKRTKPTGHDLTRIMESNAVISLDRPLFRLGCRRQQRFFVPSGRQIDKKSAGVVKSAIQSLRNPSHMVVHLSGTVHFSRMHSQKTKIPEKTLTPFVGVWGQWNSPQESPQIWGDRQGGLINS